MGTITVETKELEQLIERAVHRALQAQQAVPPSTRWLSVREAATQYRHPRQYVTALCAGNFLTCQRRRTRGGRMGWIIEPRSAEKILGAPQRMSVVGGVA